MDEELSTDTTEILVSASYDPAASPSSWDGVAVSEQSVCAEICAYVFAD